MVVSVVFFVPYVVPRAEGLLLAPGGWEKGTAESARDRAQVRPAGAGVSGRQPRRLHLREDPRPRDEYVVAQARKTRRTGASAGEYKGKQSLSALGYLEVALVEVPEYLQPLL